MHDILCQDHNCVLLLLLQEEYERKLLTLCDEGTDDGYDNEVVYFLSRPLVNPNVFDEVYMMIQAQYHRPLICNTCITILIAPILTAW
jgi:hypothetical protein